VTAKLASNQAGLLRVGVLFRRKVVGSAATRNAIKRFTLDYFTREIKQSIGGGKDLLIIITTPIIRLDPQTKNGLAEELSLIKSALAVGNK
jgi:ribonuclease P protein component